MTYKAVPTLPQNLLRWSISVSRNRRPQRQIPPYISCPIKWTGFLSHLQVILRPSYSLIEPTTGPAYLVSSLPPSCSRHRAIRGQSLCQIIPSDLVILSYPDISTPTLLARRHSIPSIPGSPTRHHRVSHAPIPSTSEARGID